MSAESQAQLHLVLVTPEIPANTGNAVRLCAVTGAALHLIEPLGFRLTDRHVRRAGLDYWRYCQPRVHLTFEAFEREQPQARCFFLSARAEASLFTQRFQPGDALVLGPESSGLSPQFLDVGQRRAHTLRLPMPGHGRSLNLATCAGIAVYEVLRQLGRLKPAGRESVCPV